jgi:hypothetical protein
MRGSLLTGFCKSSPPEGRPISMLLRCQHIFRGSYGYLDMGQTFFMPLEFQVFHVKTPIPFFHDFLHVEPVGLPLFAGLLLSSGQII